MGTKYFDEGKEKKIEEGAFKKHIRCLVLLARQTRGIRERRRKDKVYTPGRGGELEKTGG